MKLVLATPEYGNERGGIGRYLYGIYSNLPAERTLVLNDDKLFSGHWLFLIQRLFLKLRKYPDAVLHISHVLPYGTVALILKILTGRKYIISLHGMDYFLALGNTRKRFLLRWILKFASGVTANTESLRKLVEVFSKREVIVLYPSIPQTLIGSPLELRAEMPLRWLMLGRLVERKGFDTAIEALKFMPEARITIAGDGPDRLRLEKLAAESGFYDRVTFTGRVDDALKIKLFLEHDVFVLPTREIGSDKEGFGIVYLEAQFFGLPVIGGEGIGVREAIHPDLRAHAIRHTPESLAQAIRDVGVKAPRISELREFASNFEAKRQAQYFWKWFKHL
ncbi:MAG: glycosyltransferase family 4 protein [bacterium]